MSEPYFKIARKLLSSNLWLDEKFTRGQAWVDLVGLASFTDSFIRVRGIRVEVPRGFVPFSETKLAERWQWSRKKVDSFLEELEKEQQIEQQKTNVTTLIHIVNYEEYQGTGTAESTAKAPQKHRKSTAKAPQLTYKENVENVENVENITTTTSCPEPSSAPPSEPVTPSTDPTVIEFPTNRPGEVFEIKTSFRDEMQTLFQAVDVDQALRNMRAWLIANQTNRKTRTGIPKFITSWLTKEQNRGGSHNQAPRGQPPTPTTFAQHQAQNRANMAKAILIAEGQFDGTDKAGSFDGVGEVVDLTRGGEGPRRIGGIG